MSTSNSFFKKLLNYLPIILIVFTAMLTVNAQPNRVDSSFNAYSEVNSISTANFILQPDNKTIVFGDFHIVNGVINNSIARLNADGTVDNTFNCAVCDFPVTSVLLQPDGKIIIGGETSEQSGQSRMYRLNSDGSRDASFTSPFPSVVAPESNRADVRAIQPDGKILVVLISRRFANFINYKLYRLNPNGTVDNTFTTINISSSSGGVSGERPGKISVLPDGKILLVTNSIATCPTCASGNALLKRFNPDGTIDTTFELLSVTNPGPSASINDFYVQSDGSVIIVGKFTAVNGASRQNIAKLSPAGILTSSFSTPFTSIINRVEVLPDGKVLVSTNNSFYRFSAEGVLDNSFVSPSNLTQINYWMLDSAGRIFLFGVFVENGASVRKFARLGQNGSIESSFTVSFGTVGPVTTIAAQADGKVIIAGGFIRVNGVPRVSMARVNADGTLDSTFNSGSGFNVSSVSKIIVQPDGKILVGGYFRFYNGIFRPRLLRLNTDGSIDETFSQIFSDGSTQELTMALLPDGKILVGGGLGTIGGTGVSNALPRLNANGTVDVSFRPVFGDATIRSIVVQTDGKIMVGGTFTNVNGVNRTGLVRLNADGSSDASFDAGNITFVRQIEIQANGKYLVLGSGISRLNNDGSTDTSFLPASFNGIINQFLAQPDGSILVVGQFTTVGGLPRSGLTRLKSNGTVDASFFPIGANNQIRVIERQADGRILVGGDFTRLANTIRIGLARLIVTPNSIVPTYDYDGDGKSDISVFRDGIWHLQRSQAGFGAVYWGLASDKIAPADFDGDGKTDPTVYRPSNGEWSILRSSDNTATVLRFGAPEDLPRPADFDGDGKADITVFRPSNGTWYRINSSNNQFYAVQFGAAGDAPVIADFDGDGKADIAVYRPSNGTWYWLRSSDGHFAVLQFGISEDKPVPADYDGDGKTDIAVWRPSNGVWYRLNSSNNQFFAAQFGMNGDVPTVGDYDGDGKADIAVFRNGIWYLQQSTAGFTTVQFGAATDKPVQNAFVP
jgi:uncharacterized delta-60 repeat protein